jgi:hypothetical protein
MVRVRQGKNWDRSQRPPRGRRQFITFTSSAIAQEEPNQAIQNKHLRCLLDQIRICVCHCATCCSHALCCVMHGKMSLCWPLCLCAGLLFLAFRPHPKCSPPLLAAAAQWWAARATPCLPLMQAGRPSLPPGFQLRAEDSQLYKLRLPYLILFLC